MKGMFSPELEKLIEITLADGVLTPQEEKVLAKKAAEEGVDLDQLSVYLQYIMQQRHEEEAKKRDQAKMELEEASRKLMGKTCPFCGKPVQQLADQCPHCKGIITAEASQELLEIIDKLEDALVELKAGDDYKKSKAQVDKFIRRANMYYENNPKVQKLLQEIAKETAEAEKKAKNSERNKTILSVFKGIGNFIKNHKALTYCVAFFCVALCLAFCGEDYEEAEQAKAQQEQAEQQAFIEEIDDYIEDGNIKEAARVLEKKFNLSTEDQWDLVKKYDSIFLKVIREMIENNQFRQAEALALTFKSRVTNDFTWQDTSCYTYLKAKFKANKKDFSMLKSEYDYDN